MAVESHPKFNDWCAALDALKGAKDDLRSALQNGEWPGGVKVARGALAMAQGHYNRISDEIDADEANNA